MSAPYPDRYVRALRRLNLATQETLDARAKLAAGQIEVGALWAAELTEQAARAEFERVAQQEGTC